MAYYAENTSVPVERSRAEIEETLTRYGASEFATGWRDSWSLIMFKAKGKHVKFVLKFPPMTEKRFTHGGRYGAKLSDNASSKKYDQEKRRLWRALLLSIKGKLEAVQSGIAVFEDEFMANIVMPNGQCISEWLVPQIEQAYADGNMPPMFPMLESK